MAAEVLNPVPPDDPSRGETGKFKLRPEPIDMNAANAAGPSQGPKTPGVTRDRDRSRKIGHRRVDELGQVTYKKKPTSELMAAIQLGIGQSIGGLAAKPERDVLMQDFAVVESVFFPGEGSNITPAHHYSDFRFKTYAPVAFRYFRELFDIQPDDFMLSLCDEAMVELSNPGASGSIFYITSDDEFIIKTVQHKEADFLQKLLPGYYMNLNQNPRTLLPKFYGLYCYQCGGKNIRFVIMNNLLPSSIKLHEKYDLKGSTYKRKASKGERSKPSPTLKDLDFQAIHPEGVILEKETYDAVVKTILRDCMVLESFKIMDFSFLLGVHNLDADRPRTVSEDSHPTSPTESMYPSTSESEAPPSGPGKANLQRGKSLRTRLAQYSTALEAIQANSEPVEIDNEDVPLGGIPARNTRGERLLLYVGIIDILQSYRLKKKLEHSMKAILTDGDTVSVHRPSFYSQRFQHFFSHKVFKFVQTPLKHSPSKKKGVTAKVRAMTEIPEPRERTRLLSERTQRTISFSDEAAGAMGGKPDLLPEDSTPPPTFSEAIATSTGPRVGSQGMQMRMVGSSVVSKLATGTHMEYSDSYRSEQSSRTQLVQDGNSPDMERTSSLEYQSGGRTNSALSMTESTPTHTDYTEGTPSFTASSPSCSSDMLDAPVTSEGQYSPTRSPVHSSLVQPQTSSSTETSYASAVEIQNGDSEGDRSVDRRSGGSSSAVYVDASADLDDDSPTQVNSAPSQLLHEPHPPASYNQSESVREPPSMQSKSLPHPEQTRPKYVTRLTITQSDLVPPPVTKHAALLSVLPPFSHAQTLVTGNHGDAKNVTHSNGNNLGRTPRSSQTANEGRANSRHSVSTSSLPAAASDFSQEVDKILEEDWRNLTPSQLKQQRKRNKGRQFNSAVDIRARVTTPDRGSPSFVSQGFGRAVITLPGSERHYTPVKLQNYKQSIDS